MAEFPGLVFTDVGRAMISRAGSNKKEDKLIVTRADFGDGMYEGDISRLTNIVSKKLSATIVSYKDNMNGQWSYTFSYDNSSLNVGFNHREVGIFAKNGETGTEKLLCYSNAGNRYSYLGSKDKLIPLQTMTAYIALGDLKNVTAVIDVSNAVKLQQVLEEIEKHNKNEVAHIELFSTDTTPTTDQGLGSNNSFLNLGARIKWVKSYVKNAMSSYKEFVAEQIKDFGAGVLKYLLSKTVTNLSTLEEGSVAYQIVDAVLRVSGRRYSLGETGYMLFGKLFGGFCIQWGVFPFGDDARYVDVSLPIAATVLAVASIDYYFNSSAKSMDLPRCVSIEGYSLQSKTRLRALSAYNNMGHVQYIALTKID